MAASVWRSRELTWCLFRRDLTAGYRQSVLGVLWAVLPTVATAALFAWLTSARILSVQGTQLPYGLFILVNMTLWQFFSGALTGITSVLAVSRHLITRVSFPRESLVLATLGRHVFDVGVRALFVAGVFALYRICPPWPALCLPLVFLPLLCLTLGLGFLLTIANAIARDVAAGLAVLLMFWMFLTPVVYPAPTEWPRSLLNVVNPVSPFLIAAQDLLIRGSLTQPGNFAIGCAVSLAVFLAGWKVFYLTESAIIERV